MKIYRVETYAVRENIRLSLSDLYNDYDKAMDYYNKATNNPNTISVSVTEMESSDESSIFRDKKIIAKI